MPDAFVPSSALAHLCAALHRWTIERYPVDQWLKAAEAAIAASPKPAVAARSMSVGELEAAVAGALGSTHPDVIPNERRFVDVVRAVNTLDDWHEPLDAAAMGAALPSAAHNDAFLRLGMGGGYNPDDGHGLLVPRNPIGSPGGPARVPARPPNSILHSTTYVPALMSAGNPNDAGLASLGRTVAVRYLPPSLLRLDNRPPPGPRPLVAIAPVHQEAADAEVVCLADPPRYGLRVLRGMHRIPAILDRAVREQAHILFLPEMALDEDNLADFGTMIRRVGLTYLNGSGRLPALRYVVAGCVAPPRGGDRGRNYVVIMDHEGSVVLRQRKLSRWNLKPHHQYSYGLSRTLDAGADELLEDIEPGTEIWIADLAGFGRFATLICADMSYEDPGDFLIHNVDLDWLHAPIMDRTNVVVSAPGSPQPWMIDRAARAARGGARRVIVTNSVLFTSLINVTNSRPGSPYPPYANCSIAFMIDGTGPDLRYRDVEVAMPAGSTIVDTVRWAEGFVDFPT